MHMVDAKGLLSAGNGINVYRGCTHGCIYCDSRSSCYRFTHAFEDVEVKRNAPELLDAALRRKRERCMIATGAMCDPYMPLEEELLLTRRCAEVIERRGFGLAVQTKSARILRDADLLEAINARARCVAQMTLTTCDEALCRKIEPHVSTTRERVEALKELRKAGIPTVVWLSPILPFLNDTEENIRGIVEHCVDAGVRGVICFGMGLTLRDGNREYFYRQLDRLFPGMKERYIRAYGSRYQLLSPRNGELMELFHTLCEEGGLLHDNGEIFSYLSAFEDKRAGAQTSLFD